VNIFLVASLCWHFM